MSEYARRVSGVAAVGVAVALALSGCQAETYSDEADAIVEVPQRYAEAPVAGEATADFCGDLGGQTLDRLTAQVFTDNLSLRAAWARLRAAEAGWDAAWAAQFPVVSAEVSASRSRQLGQAEFDPQNPGQAGEPQPEQANQFQVGVGASYEVDVWGRLSSQAEAARLDALATRSDAEAVAITLSAQLAEQWFDIVYQRERLELLEAQADISRRFLELLLLRLRHGTATALDVNQQKQQVASLEAQLVQVTGQLAAAQNQLAVLLGQPPQGFEAPEAEALPEVPDLPAAGIPADLLEQRPDLRAARLRLAAADERVEAAVAARLPQLRLSANVFTQAEELGELFEYILWQVMGQASQAVFDAGLRESRVDQAEALAEQQLYDYGQTLLDALRDVQNALVLEARQVDYLEQLDEQVEIAQQALDLARRRYRQGGADYLRVLTSLQSLQQAEQALLQGQRQRLTFRIQLCRALGGDWTRDLEPTPPPGSP